MKRLSCKALETSCKSAVVQFGLEGAHVLDEAARDWGRQLYRFERHRRHIGARLQTCESAILLASP